MFSPITLLQNSSTNEFWIYTRYSSDADINDGAFTILTLSVKISNSSFLVTLENNSIFSHN